MIVDVHSHYYPTDYLERIGRWPELPPDLALLRDQGMSERMDLLDQHGIDVQVLSVSQAQPYLSDAAAASDAAKLGNDRFIELCQLHAGRFFVFAALPLPHVDAALAEIDRVWNDPHVVGVTIGCSINETHVDDPLLEPVYEELGRRRAKVQLHPRGERCVVDGTDYNFNWMVGATFEDTIAALRLTLSGIADRHPGIQFIVPHLGGTLPFLMARILRVGGGRARDALHRMYYDTVSGSVEGLKAACEHWGADHLLFGTDYPYCTVDEFGHRLSYLDEAGIDEKELVQIRGARASQLLQL